MTDYQAFRRFNAQRNREIAHQRDVELAVFWELPIPSFTKHRPHIPMSVQRAVLERDGNRCVLCGSTEGLSFDHIVHFSAGGEDTEENLRILCLDCNRKRGNRE